MLFYLDSEDISESQDYDEESNLSGKKSDKKPTSLGGWIKQIWSEIEGRYHFFVCKIKKMKYKESLSFRVCVGGAFFF